MTLAQRTCPHPAFREEVQWVLSETGEMVLKCSWWSCVACGADVTAEAEALLKVLTGGAMV